MTFLGNCYWIRWSDGRTEEYHAPGGRDPLNVAREIAQRFHADLHSFSRFEECDAWNCIKARTALAQCHVRGNHATA